MLTRNAEGMVGRTNMLADGKPETSTGQPT
jgi:hypothetical protein